MPRRRNEIEDELSLSALSQIPRPGEIWWCDGTKLGLMDGGKTRPILIVGLDGATDAMVLPLTARKPADGDGVLVAHRGGTSWLTGTPFQARRVARSSLISPLGAWMGYAAWRRALVKDIVK